jgi:hypothetical protein
MGWMKDEGRLREGRLREKALDAIKNGTLPAMAPRCTWGGPGNGKSCAVCGEPVKRSEMELEIEYPRDGKGAAGRDHYHFHIRCFAAWEFESRNHLTHGTISSNDP